MWILIRWLPQKPADLDLHCFQNWIAPSSAGQGLSTLFLLQDLSIFELGGDGSGTLYIPATRQVTIAEELLRTHLWSSVNNEGILILPLTIYVEQTFTTESRLIGVQQFYTRGSTQLSTSASSLCSLKTVNQGEFFFHTFNVFDGGRFTFYDQNSYNVDSGFRMYADFFHMEGTAKGEITKSSYIQGRAIQIEKQSMITGLGYTSGSGPGAGPSCGCGTGAGHGGVGGSCQNCGCGNCHRGCTGGTTYDSAVTPSEAGSGAGNSGGAAIKLVHQYTIFDGTINMDGKAGSSGKGGGAGGAIWLDAEYVNGWGQLSVKGGSGSFRGWNTYNGDHFLCHHSYTGGGGGGGRIRSFGIEETSKVVMHYRFVNGGSSSYSHGASGSVHQSHSNACSDHGNWGTSRCNCNDGYAGFDCQFICDGAETCSGNGICMDKGTCDCNDNFVGYHCENMCHRNTSCSGHGDCSLCGSCICDSCYHGIDCATECSNNGLCQNDRCECDSCHLGDYCESECNGHGTCNKETMACTCDKYWGGQKCTLKGCAGKDLGCSGHGVCNSASGFCYCDPGYKGR